VPIPEPVDHTGIPARAQPWTEYEARVLPDLVKLYSVGLARGSREDEYFSRPVLRGSRPQNDEPVATPADLVGRKLPVRRFVTSDGGAVDLDELAGKRNVLLTVLRGFGGQVCVYCTAQTRGLAQFAGEFAAKDTEVFVVFPGPASGLEAFLEAYRRTFGTGEKPPYKLLYDTDLALTRALHIEDNIAVPTSIVLDRKGVVRWCHVAKDHADRPSAQQVLEQIEALPKR
jgi:peroxiredoxin